MSCVSVGPDFNKPTAPLADSWLEENRERIEGIPVDSGAWWKLLKDPVLDSMIAAAFMENLTLQVAAISSTSRQFSARSTTEGFRIAGYQG